ncbi:MAG: ROK family protein [Woeseiaceae bacterium]
MRLAVDIGATKTAFGIFDDAHKMAHRAEEPTATDDWKGLADTVVSNIAKIENRYQLVGSIGVSIAGTIDPRDGIASCANIPSISGRNLGDDLGQLLGRKVLIRNDAECLALAEATHGAGRHYRQVFAIILGSGIGGAIVTDGRLLSGATGQIGEWGHGNRIDHLVALHNLNSRACGCGRRNCLDLFGAGLGMANIHEDLSATRSTAREILSSWHSGNAAATKTVDTFIEIVSSQLVLAINVIDPEIVPVAGGLSNDTELVAALDEATRTKSLGQIDRPLIVPAENSVHGCLLGASLLGGDSVGNTS